MTTRISAHDSMVQRVSAALDYVDKHGNLHGFATSDEESRALIEAATAQGMIEWNAALERHQLSTTAVRWLKVFFDRRRSDTQAR
jgi:hypothetical protein